MSIHDEPWTSMRTIAGELMRDAVDDGHLDPGVVEGFLDMAMARYALARHMRRGDMLQDALTALDWVVRLIHTRDDASFAWKA